MISTTVPAGARLLSVRRAAEKLSRSRSWVWEKAKNDPSFPKPIRLGGEPVFLEHELDHYIANLVEKSRDAVKSNNEGQPRALRVLHRRAARREEN